MMKKRKSESINSEKYSLTSRQDLIEMEKDSQRELRRACLNLKMAIYKVAALQFLGIIGSVTFIIKLMLHK